MPHSLNKTSHSASFCSSTPEPPHLPWPARRHQPVLASAIVLPRMVVWLWAAPRHFLGLRSTMWTSLCYSWALMISGSRRRSWHTEAVVSTEGKLRNVAVTQSVISHVIIVCCRYPDRAGHSDRPSELNFNYELYGSLHTTRCSLAEAGQSKGKVTTTCFQYWMPAEPLWCLSWLHFTSLWWWWHERCDRLLYLTWTWGPCLQSAQTERSHLFLRPWLEFLSRNSNVIKTLIYYFFHALCVRLKLLFCWWMSWGNTLFRSGLCYISIEMHQNCSCL